MLTLTWWQHYQANGSRLWFNIPESCASMRILSTEHAAKTWHVASLHMKLNTSRSNKVLDKFLMMIICQFSMLGYLNFTNGRRLGCLLTKIMTSFAGGVKILWNFSTCPSNYWAPQWIRCNNILGWLTVCFVSKLRPKKVSKSWNLWDLTNPYGTTTGKLKHHWRQFLGQTGRFS